MCVILIIFIFNHSLFFFFLYQKLLGPVFVQNWPDICIISVIRVIRDLNVDFIAPTSTSPLCERILSQLGWENLEADVAND